MKKINLKGISEILSEKEMQQVTGGSGATPNCSGDPCTTDTNCCTLSPHCVSLNNWGRKTEIYYEAFFSFYFFTFDMSLY